MSHDWLPAKRVEQLAMAKTWKTVLDKTGADWDVTDAELLELTALITEADEMLTKAMAANRNAIVTARCNEAFGALIAFMRNLRNRRFFVPPLTNPDLISLGLHRKAVQEYEPASHIPTLYLLAFTRKMTSAHL
ncbi:MAG: hypothetical protein FWG13_05965 [Leptospirales bacterium]|nr:hypothetical protein [Leptospirales bacterium]